MNTGKVQKRIHLYYTLENLIRKREKECNYYEQSIRIICICIIINE